MFYMENYYSRANFILRMPKEEFQGLDVIGIRKDNKNCKTPKA